MRHSSRFIDSLDAYHTSHSYLCSRTLDFLSNIAVLLLFFLCLSFQDLECATEATLPLYLLSSSSSLHPLTLDCCCSLYSSVSLEITRHILWTHQNHRNSQVPGEDPIFLW